MSWTSAWQVPNSRARRVVLAVGIYLLAVVVFASVAGPERLTTHTPFNHYAHLADAWLHGRQDLRNGPPAYAYGNDFAVFEGKTYISFPPFPAVLMLPFVKLAGSPERFQDGQFVIWLAGVGPAVLFLILEKLRRTGRSERGELANAFLALLFAFGSVYFFTAVQGTVWFAAHVVGVAFAALYILVALDASAPLLAGVLMACSWTTRPTLLLTSLLFAAEAFRVSLRSGLPTEGAWRCRVVSALRDLDWGALLKRYALFAIPVLISFGLGAWTNYTRFHTLSPFAFGHEYLTVAWHERITRWGLFGYHYLAKNLAVVFTLLPWLPAKGEALAFGAPFKVNEHGLALWFTTPIYLWLLWPKRTSWLYVVCALCAGLPAFQLLLYQNSGWQQFGYRFSNDYALFLFVLFAIGGRTMGALFKTAALWSVAWNLFGAISFGRANFQRFYFSEGSQTILYQPDR